jgi:hypothetical protein
MTRRDKEMTAAELMAKLDKDSQFQELRSAKEERRRHRQDAFDLQIAPYVSMLNCQGVCGDSIQHIAEENAPLSNSAVDILLLALMELDEPRVLETIVRALAAAKAPFDGRPLVKCFESTRDEALKWAIANTIACNHPLYVDEWVKKLCENPYWKKTLRGLGYFRKRR